MICLFLKKLIIIGIAIGFLTKHRNEQRSRCFLDWQEAKREKQA